MSEFPDEVDLVLTVGGVVLAEDFVEPDGGLGEGVGARPGVPRVVGLGLAGDESPVDGRDVVLLGDRQVVVEGAAGAAGHVLGAEDGAAERLELLDARFELFGPAVVVEADNVGLGKLNFCGGAFAIGVRPVAYPDAAGEGLGGMLGACPGEGEWKQMVDALGLVGCRRILLGGIVGLVPDVPCEHARIVGEGTDDAFDVGLELGFGGGVGEFFSAGTLHPAGVMHAGDGRVLRAEFGVGVPAGVEEYEDGTDAVVRGDGEKFVEVLLEAFGILLPELVLQEDAHGIHADTLRHAEFFVVELRIPGCGLKHLQLIDGVGGDVVGSHQPRLLGVPLVRMFCAPTSRGFRGRRMQRRSS
jgi:hypothetical protein